MSHSPLESCALRMADFFAFISIDFTKKSSLPAFLVGRLPNVLYFPITVGYRFQINHVRNRARNRFVAVVLVC